MDPGFKPTILAPRPRAPTILSAPKVVHTIKPSPNREPSHQTTPRVPQKPPQSPAAPKPSDPRVDQVAVSTARKAAGRPTKLITVQGQFRPDEFAEALTQNTEFLVVGVIGPDGVGKTQALSLLSKSGVFREESTRGVDAMVTAQRVILLDTQAVLSAAQLVAQLSAAKDSSSEAAAAVEKNLRIQELQQTVLMLACCHVVLVLQDCLGDLPLMQLIRVADMLCSGLAASTDAPICMSNRRLVWIYSHLAPSQCTAEAREQLRRFNSKFFEHCHFMADPTDVPSTLGTRELAQEDLLTLTQGLNAAEMEALVYRWDDKDQEEMSERAWMEHVTRIWDLILRKSSIVNEYINKL